MQVSGEDLVRSREWDRIRDFVTATHRDPVTLVLSGEAGAGKSTLWRTATSLADRAGHRVLSSEPTAAEQDLPFAGLIDLLGEALSGIHDIPEPRREALEIAMLVRPPGGAPPTAHAVGLGVLDVLRALAATGPTLLAIDDVQWLDGATLGALTFAVRRAGDTPIRLLLSARTPGAADLLSASPPPSEGWHDLATAASRERVELQPLDVRQIRQLLPFTLDLAGARRVYEQSRGNPFWAREVAATLGPSGKPVSALARTLTDRLAGSLTPGATETVALVGAAGRISVSTALEVLAHLDDPLAGVDEAVVAGMITEVDNRLAAAHPLIGAAAVEFLAPAARKNLYLRLADAAPSPEQAAHFAALAAGDEPDEDVAAALDTAAHSAQRRAGIAEAAQFALRALQLTVPGDAENLTRRRIRTAELAHLSGDFQGAHELAAGVDLGRLSPAEVERFLPLLLDLTDVVRGESDARSIIAGLCNELGADPRRRAAILASAADFSYGLPGRRAAMAAQAVRDADQAGHAADASLHRALLNLAIAQVTAGDGLDRELLDRAERLEDLVPVDRLHDSADLVRGLWSRRVEDLDTSRQALLRSVRLARELGDEFAQVTSLTHLAINAELAGSFDSARDFLTQAAGVSAWREWPTLAPWHTEPRCYLMIADGDLDGALELVEQAMPDADGQPPATRFIGNVVRGTISGWRGDTSEAVRWFERAARYADACEFADPGVRRGLDTSLAEAYVTQGRTDDAARIASWLRETGDRLHRPTLSGNASRIESQIAARLGTLDVAADLARAAVADHERSPLRLELARSLLTLGQVERQRRARKRSREALIAAREVSVAVGHRPNLSLVEGELARVAAVRSGRELTTTEQRVAELIADGASNQNAADALFVNVRTVESHLASVYRKLDVHNRAGLARSLPPGPDDSGRAPDTSA